MKEKLLSYNLEYTQKVEALLSHLSRFSDQQLNHKSSPESWSALQVAEHLALSEASSLAYVRKKMTFTRDFPTVGLPEIARSLFIRVLLYQPIKFKAPPVVGTAALPSHNSLEKVSLQWMTTRRDWHDFFESMPEELANKAVFKHPRAGRIGWWHLIRFFKDHYSRHQQQIKKALSNQVST